MRRKMKILKIVLLFSLLINMFPSINVSVFADETQDVPTNLRVEALDPNVPAIGYNGSAGYYIDLNCNVTSPPDTVQTYLNFYIDEASKPYISSTSTRILKNKNVPYDANGFRMDQLKNGTIYYIDATAYHTYDANGVTYTTVESASSNTIKVLTDIKLDAYSYGTGQIELEWDDVWDLTNRINYELYISEDSNFTNTQPIYIDSSQIGQNDPVTVNEAAKKLDYIYTVQDIGSVYYVKIVPSITDTSTYMNASSDVAAASSYIIVKPTKVSDMASGSIWDLVWSPVETGLSDPSIKTTYWVYKGIYGSSFLPEYLATANNTNFNVVIPNDGNQYYFIIIAQVEKDGVDLFPNIKIQSDKVLLQEQGVNSTPSAVEFVNNFERVAGNTIIDFNTELTNTSATILWSAPTNGDGQVDAATYYDMWLITNSNQIDNPPSSTQILSSYQPASNNQVLDGTTIVGYKYTLQNLAPNSTYYVKMVAKKIFMDYVNNSLQSTTYTSWPALKVFITKGTIISSQPYVPAKPPFGIHKLADGTSDVTTTQAVIILKNLWYEKYNTVTQEWEYIKTEKYFASDIPDYNPSQLDLDGIIYRKVEYDPGIVINVGCIEYSNNMDYNNLLSLPANKITNFPVQANDPNEIAAYNPDGLPHNILIPVIGLSPNTSYIIWLTATDTSTNTSSNPSDPIIITTKPQNTTTVEKPTVPTFNYSDSGDNYIDIGWDVRNNYNYNIKYSTEDDPNDPNTVNTTATSDQVSNAGYYRINGLTPNTTYYFCIQAEVMVNGVASNPSNWSDSYAVQTLDITLPVPQGFGIKDDPNAVTTNSIEYEWLQDLSYDYTLEIATDSGFNDSNTYNSLQVDDYIVTSLTPNTTYYARLYSVDPNTGIKSDPSIVVSCMTKTSNDEYNLAQPIGDVIAGDIVVKGSTITNNTWNAAVTNVNADRLVEKMFSDNPLDYVIDLETPPSKASKLNILISNKVFNALNTLKENLILKTKDEEFIFRPNIFDRSTVDESDFNYDIEIDSVAMKNVPASNNITFKSDESVLSIQALDDSNSILSNITQLNIPLKINYFFDTPDFYTEGKTAGLIYDAKQNVWNKLLTTCTTNDGGNSSYLTFETNKVGSYLVGEEEDSSFDDVYYTQYETAINDVKSKYDIQGTSDNLFEPDQDLTIGDAVKFAFTFLGYNANSDYLQDAVNAGLIDNTLAQDPTVNCTYGDALNMVLRIYELKAKLNFNSDSERSTFIQDNSLEVSRDNAAPLTSGDIIQRGEFIYLIDQILIALGEITQG